MCFSVEWHFRQNSLKSGRIASWKESGVVASAPAGHEGGQKLRIKTDAVAPTQRHQCLRRRPARTKLAWGIWPQGRDWQRDVNRFDPGRMDLRRVQGIALIRSNRFVGRTTPSSPWKSRSEGVFSPPFQAVAFPTPKPPMVIFSVGRRCIRSIRNCCRRGTALASVYSTNDCRGIRISESSAGGRYVPAALENWRHNLDSPYVGDRMDRFSLFRRDS